MMEGASLSLPFQSVSHLEIINASMVPNRARRKSIYGMNSHKKSMADL